MGDPCARWEQLAAGLEGQIDATADLLAHASSPEKMDLMLRIATLNRQLAIAKAELSKCRQRNRRGRGPRVSPRSPDLDAWLARNPRVARAIKWQNQPADWGNAYAPPSDANKTAWASWAPDQKAELKRVYQDAVDWFMAGAHQVPMDPKGLTDQPANAFFNVADDNVTVVVDIPVQPVWVCGHELAYFITEKRYLDHGDDPYALTVKNSNAPILSVLIDEATYAAWFTDDATVNIEEDPLQRTAACDNVGRRAAEF